ncbi:centrosomal protein of 70 kDa-like isoform X2 [Symsagittifera roscoffensis]|uniref:centrosomal protein of 70 kDa-like isoform X2 n=1 Tax=Symsagittifera roscoffensis TaxID=84072 RepID=UPI00307B2315
MDSDTVVSDQVTLCDPYSSSNTNQQHQNNHVSFDLNNYKSNNNGLLSSPSSVLVDSNASATLTPSSSVGAAMPETEDDTGGHQFVVVERKKPEFREPEPEDSTRVDDSFWEDMNQLLQCHGIQKLNPTDMLCLNRSSAFTVKSVMTQLVKDNDRRQAIIQDLLKNNNTLKDEVSQQRELSVRSGKTIRDMESVITRQKNKLRDVEESRVGDMQGLSDKLYSLREEHHELRNRCSKLDNMNKHLRLEVDRAHRQIALGLKKEEKRRRDNEQVFNQVRAQLATGERISDKKILAMIDHYEGAIEQLRSKVASMVERQKQQKQKNLSMMTTTDIDETTLVDTTGEEEEDYSVHDSSADKTRNTLHEYSTLSLQSAASSSRRTREQDEDNPKEAVHYYRHLCESLEKDVSHLKRKLKESEKEKTLMKIEHDTRTSYVNGKVDSKSGGRGGRKGEGSSNEPTGVDEIRYLNIETTRKYLKMFCDHMGVDDLNEVIPALRQMGEKNANHLKMKKFIQEVTEITSDTSLPSTLTQGNKREAQARRTYNTVTHTLRLWVQELKAIQTLYQSVTHLVSTVMPTEKILPLSADLSVSDLINYVDSITQQNNKQLQLDSLDPTGTVDVKTLRDMVKHFQQLFDCPHLQGVYPRMNDVFSKLEESRNTINTFKDLLGLDQSSTTTRTLIGAFEAVCREFNNRTYEQLKTLISSDDLLNITEKVRIHDEFFPEFECMAEEVMHALGVDRLDRVVPAVRILKLVSSSNRSH